MPMSSATLMASSDAPDRPLLVNPAAYSPAFPFHPFGNGAFGNPFLEKNSLSWKNKERKWVDNCSVITSTKVKPDKTPTSYVGGA